MKKRFTFLIAVLFVTLLIPLSFTVMGQTRTDYVLNQVNFTTINSGSGYAAYDGNHSINGITIVSYNVMINSEKLQFKKNGGNLYNSTAMPGNITKITLSENVSLTIYVGTSSNPSSTTVTSGSSITGNNTYFKVINNSTSALSTSSITVEYSSGPATYTVTYNAGLGSGDPMVDNNGGNGYESGTNYIVKANSGEGCPNFTKIGHSFYAWYDNSELNGTAYGTGENQTSSFSITNNTNLYAKWNINQYNVVVSEVANVILTATYGDNNTINEGGNANVNYGTEITLNVADLADGKAFVWDVYKTGEPATKVTVTDNKFNVPAFNVTISGNIEDVNYSNTYTSNVTLSTDGGTSASNCKVKINNVEYDGIKAGTNSVAGAWIVTVPANTNKLHLHFAGWNGESVTLAVTPTGYSSNISLTANSGISGSGSTYTWGTGAENKDPNSSDHYKVITFDGFLEEAVALTFTASSGNRFVVWGVNAELTTDTYITAGDVDIASNATAGEITYTVHNTPDPAGTLTANTTSDWITIGAIGEKVPFTCTTNPNTQERTATVTLTYTYGDNETTTADVIVTQAPLVVTYTYTLATSIENGKHYIITNGGTKIMDSQSSNNRAAIDVLSNDYYDNEKNEYSIPSDAGIYEFVINGPDADGYYTIHDAKPNTGYLYAASSSNNYLKTQSFNNNNGRWSIAIVNEGENLGKATVVAQGDNSNKYMRFNSTLFSCYGENSNVSALPFLYVRNDANYEFYKDIAKYTTPAVGDPVNGWNFIASPLADAYTISSSDLVAGTYDLYRLNNNTWENYKNPAHAEDFTSLNNGWGYLYANSANVTLHFRGAINTYTTVGNANQKDLTQGWNLIGNPYSIPVYINMPYYRMNSTGTEVEAVSDYWSNGNVIPACTGIVVKATGDNEKVTFTTTAPDHSTGNPANIQMTLSHAVATRGGSNDETIDNAIVSFNEGIELEKFYFGNPSANIYIPQNQKEYAIVSANAQGEMPVNFVAAENGEYTLTVNLENVEMNYLHLIDNMTGADVDLLVNPSYTFDARTTDYTSRFRLVFSANGVEENENDSQNENFAYINNGEIVVNGSGTVQVIDALGRILLTREVTPNSSLPTPNYSGVYVLRLIGEKVKTQKIVVK